MPAGPSRHIAPIWHKSRASANQAQCVEIAREGPSVLVRDSRDPSGVVLTVTPAQWSAFLKNIKKHRARRPVNSLAGGFSSATVSGRRSAAGVSGPRSRCDAGPSR